MTSLADQARTFLALHQPGSPVVLPTVWDPWSAHVAVDAGAVALTVGSAPVAACLGGTDHEGLSLDDMLGQVRRVCQAVDVPVSADLESGYGASPDQIVSGLLEAGAVGLNLEDTVHGEGGRLRTTEEHAAFIARIREEADKADVPIVVNARTDLLLRTDGEDEERLEQAITRLQGMADVGADVVYPVGILDDDSLRRITAEVPLPVNALARPSEDSYERLASLGVARISFGPHLQRALADEARQLLGRWI